MPFRPAPEDIPAAFAAAWNRNDATALAAIFAPDADFVNVVGLWWHNQADIEKAHAYGLSTFFRNTTINARRIKIRRLCDTLAIIHTRWRLSGQLGKNGEPLDDRTSVMSFVVEKQENNWVVLAAQNTDVIPGAETFVSTDGKLTAEDYRTK